MKKKIQTSRKRLLSVLLAVVMVLTALPLTALSAVAATSGDFEYEVLSETDKTCQITDYTGSATDLTIPSKLDGYTVTSIGDGAFEYCTALTSITIPDSVTSIGDWAFRFCTSLTSIAIPDSVTSIGGEAFSYCTSLTSITIPDSVTSIGWGAFRDCDSLTEIHVDAGNPNYTSESGVLFNIEKTELIGYPAGKQDSSYAIPANVTSIGDFAFSGCTALTRITIPDRVTSIGWHAFSDCTALESITIPNSVTSIGDDAFYGCTALTSITIPNSVTEIGGRAFSDCTALTEIHVDAGNLNYTSESGVLFNKEKTELIGYPAGKQDSSYAIPANVTSIGDFAFSGCTSLTSITIPDSVTSIDSYAFFLCTALASINIPDSVTSIGNSTFYVCTALTSITIPDSVTSIGWDAFRDCTSLTSITIPDSVTSIYSDTFYGCSSLASITIPDSVTSIGWDAFRDCTSLTSITIPDSVTSIGESAFAYCTALTSITIPYSVTSIGENAFLSSGLTTIYGYTGSSAEVYANENGIPFETLGDVPLAFTYQILDDGTICITGFKGNPHVEDLIIPAVYEGYTVSGVASYAFYGNNSLRSLTVEDGVKYIYELAFGECANLEHIVLPDSIEYIQVSFVDMSPSGAFYGTAYCKNPKNWDNGVLYMGNHAYTTEFIDGAEWTVFRDGTLSIADIWVCSQKVYIPRSVQHIGDRGWCGYETEDGFKDSVVYGFAGSYAETYALNHSYEFIDITPTISKPADGAAGLIELSYDQMTVGALVDELQYQDSTIQSIAVTDKSGNEVTDMNTICSSDMIFTATYFNGTTALFTVETTQTVLTGDVNGDDKINAVDARWVLQAASGARVLDDTQKAAADVNGDGKINAVDARWILQVASGVRTL